VDVVHGAVKTFKDKIHQKFERALGGHGGGGWRRIFNGPQKVQFALFVSKEAKSLQGKIATPLETIQINPGIEIRGSVSDLQSAVTRIESRLDTKFEDESRINDRKLLQQIGAWLSLVPSADNFNTFTVKLRPGSCEWIFRKADFRRWMDNSTDANSPPLFWINGIPEAGNHSLLRWLPKGLASCNPWRISVAMQRTSRSVLG
jgi:hypothetical protein